ncbi:amino acid permease [Aestuariivirga sp.]|uniref:APC family permease n=1 Tax=Aestuariivirga sp. TaxID=2650926 RepID=UPI0025C06DA4|nr:amino acid permease [Aestuariivirga sp.]MCA3554024.1 amino acid permease [Aestuariivirga sp.]
MGDELGRTLTATRGAAILLNIVVGAGLLTLPGLVQKVAGSQAPLAWAVCAIAATPLVLVFVLLGRRYPDAGGIAAYAGKAFGPAAQRVAAFLLLGAVAFGLPSIALVGGHYLAQVLPGSASLYALALVTLSLVPHLLPGDGAARVMTALASATVLVVAAMIAIGVVTAPPARITSVGLAYPIAGAFAPFMMIFFAFTGWEIGAGIAEEFRNPATDFPKAMVGSFLLVCALYGGAAFTASRFDLEGVYEAPFIRFVGPVLGPIGPSAVGLTACLIVFANLTGAVWGVSRLVFSLARSGQFPGWFAGTWNGRPVRAALATVATLLCVLIADQIWHFGLDRMLALAGQNFFILYGIAGASLFRLMPGTGPRLLAAAVVGLVVVLCSWQGSNLVYPALLGLAAILAPRWPAKSTVHASSPP